MPIPEIETLSQSYIKQFQEQKLAELLTYLNTYSKFYHEHFEKHGIHSEDILTIEDLNKIPVTVKQDLQLRNQDFVCVEQNQIIDLTTTSGTLGDPITFSMTDQDLNRLAHNEYISFMCADISAKDTIQLIVTLNNHFMAGMAYFMGLRKLGSAIARVGPGNPELQFDTIKRLSPTGFVVVPSFLLNLIDYAEIHNINLNKLSIKKAICIGDPIRNPDFTLNALGRRITDKWDMQLYSTYASTEMSSAFTECHAGQGGHHHPEMIIVEFLDEHDQPVKPGQVGEVTITTLDVEAMPLLRFKTGDLCQHYTDPCSCGRTTMRLGPIIGRRQHMIKYKGTTLYPPALYSILDELDFVKNYVVEVSKNEIEMDDILIRVGTTNLPENYAEKIKAHFQAKLRVAPKVVIQSVDEITKLQFPNMSRKPIKYFDYR